MISKKDILFIAGIFLLLLIPLNIIKGEIFYSDEYFHYSQIKAFCKGHYSVHINNIATLPGYHLIISTVARLLSTISTPGIRFISFVFSFLTIISFFLVSKKTSFIPLTASLQYAAFPIIFPFFFLIYSDVMSLLFILLAFYFTTKKEFTLAGLFASGSFFIRQNNIIWSMFFFLVIYYNEFGLVFTKKNLIRHLKKTWGFLIGFVAFLMFLFINKGLAVGDKGAHPVYHFGMGNIYFILFLFFFLFLPLNITNLKEIVSRFKKNSFKNIAILCGIFMLVVLTFKVDHLYNHLSLEYFLRNMILHFFTSSIITKIVYAIIVCYSVFSLLTIELKKSSFYLLYPFTFLFLSVSWLIEPRYYFIPFTLFLLFKKEKPRLIEYLTTVLFVLVSLILFYFIYIRKYFP